MYCKNIQGCKNEVQQLNLYWFPLLVCILYSHIQKSISSQVYSLRHSCSHLSRRVMIPTSDNYFSRVSTTPHKNVTRKSLQRLSTLLHQPWITVRFIMNTYYNHFLEGICLNTMKCHWTSLKRLSVLLYQHWLNTMSWLNFFPKFCMLQTSY